MFARAAGIVISIGLTAQAVERRAQAGVEVRVTASTPEGRWVNDLTQDQFRLLVDGRVQPVDRWISAKDMRHHVTYTLVFRGTESSPPARHSVQVQVKRPAVSLQYAREALY